MKRIKQLIVLILIFLSQQNFAQAKQFIGTPKVDKRVELLSIVFRLAGNKEYNATKFKLYNDKVENHFSPYKLHETIAFAKELRENKSISYEAVMGMAIILDDNLNSLVDFSTHVPERWSEDDANNFVRLLKKFYKDAECEEFFNENELFYHNVESKFRPVYEKLDLNWYDSFYGNEPKENFTIIVSPGCGDHNYGVSYNTPTAGKQVFAIMGTWNMDESGMPVYVPNEYLPHIIHEFNHSFVNPLMAKYKESFEDSGKEIYKALEYEMSREQTYGSWQIMLNEALVRASVIKYFFDHGASQSEIRMMLGNESNSGFIWMKPLVVELEKYDSQRDVYPTLESYIPKLSDAYKAFAVEVSQYDAQRPKVESIAEFANNDTNVSSQIKTITINFDRPLSGQGYSVNYGSKGELAFPKLNKIYYTNDNKSVVMEVELMPDKEYQLVLTGKGFKSAQGFALKTYEVSFKTAK